MSREILSGIYRITNVSNNKIYVGSSIDIATRIQTHKADLSKKRHANEKLQRAWDKYGPDSFEFSVIEIVKNKFDLLDREQWWIDAIDATKNGYNIAPIAGNMLGYKHTNETRKKLSLSLTGRKLPPEVRQKMSDRMRGVKKTPEHIAKVSAAQKGRIFSDEQRTKMSESAKLRVGRALSDATKEKISKALFGLKRPPHTEEQKAARSAWQTGKKHSQESIQKMRESQRLRFNSARDQL
jgi:group I intron endonuclease